MPRHAHGDAAEAGGNEGRNTVALRQHQRERAGPEGGGEFFCGGVQHRDLGGLREGADVHNEGIVRGTAFGAENFCAGPGVERVGRETIDRLGGHGDETAAREHAREAGQVARSGLRDAGEFLGHG